VRAVFGCADFWFEVEGWKCRVQGIYVYEESFGAGPGLEESEC